MDTAVHTSPPQGPLSIGPSEQPRTNNDWTGSLRNSDYKIGWICALAVEYAAAEANLDRIYSHLSQDGYSFTLGSIGAQNVVVARLPDHKPNANIGPIVTKPLNHYFPAVNEILIVGIGGGIPLHADIRLGDIVVGTEMVRFGASESPKLGNIIKPPVSLMSAASNLQQIHDKSWSRVPIIHSAMLSRGPEMAKFAHPMRRDQLFDNGHSHGSPINDSDISDQSRILSPEVRPSNDPKIHYGRIASGPQSVGDGKMRDQLARQLGNVCFEMRPVGLPDTLPCLVIRGICDYSDSYGDQRWHEYAAAVAAAYAKELLLDMSTGSGALESTDYEKLKCLKSLFVTDPQQDRDDILDEYGDLCGGTCRWITSMDEFKSWQQDRTRLLWISSLPGMGKTYMSVYLSGYLQSIAEQDPSAKAIFFFCDPVNKARNTALNVLRGLMYQLISHQEDLIETLLPEWKEQDFCLRDDNDSLWTLFERMLDRLQARTVYCVIDALDGRKENSMLVILEKFVSLSKSTRISASKLKLIWLSPKQPAPFPKPFSSFTTIELDTVVARKEDVARVVSQRMFNLAQKKDLSQSLHENLEAKLLEQSDYNFLRVRLVADDLEKKSAQDVKSSLPLLPNVLDGVYDQILLKLNSDHANVISRILDWVLVSLRPLRVPELCDAAQIEAADSMSREQVCLSLIKACGPLLQVGNAEMIWWTPLKEPACDSGSDTESETELRARTVFALPGCRNFASSPSSQTQPLPTPKPDTTTGSDQSNSSRTSLEKKKTSNDWASVDGLDCWRLEVTLRHQSVEDYLLRRKNTVDSEREANPLEELHSSAANRLVEYMTDPMFIGNGYPYGFTTEYMHQALVKLPLAHYAVYFWHLHSRKTNTLPGLIERNKSFFTDDSKSRDVWYKAWRSGTDDSDRVPVPVLNMASMLDHRDLAKWCFDQNDAASLESVLTKTWGYSWRNTPLLEACRRGHDDIANLLIDAGADTMARSKNGENAFQNAIYKCGVDLLRRMGAKEDCGEWLRQQATNLRNSPLDWAARYASEDKCRFLIEEHGFDASGLNPFSVSLLEGNLKLARAFANEWNVRPDNLFELLSSGVFSSHATFKAPINFILDHFPVSMNETNSEGCTVLCSASRGHWRCRIETSSKVEMVLQMGCSPAIQNKKGCTPVLCLAKDIQLSHILARSEIVQLMLRYGRLDINHTCHRGRTILHHFMATVCSMEMNQFYPDEPQFQYYLKETPIALKRLLDMGADRHRTEKQGRTALEVLRPALDRDMSDQNCRYNPFDDVESEYENLVADMVSILESYATVPIHLGEV